MKNKKWQSLVSRLTGSICLGLEHIDPHQTLASYWSTDKLWAISLVRMTSRLKGLKSIIPGLGQPQVAARVREQKFETNYKSGPLKGFFSPNRCLGLTSASGSMGRKMLRFETWKISPQSLSCNHSSINRSRAVQWCSGVLETAHKQLFHILTCCIIFVFFLQEIHLYVKSDSH